MDTPMQNPKAKWWWCKTCQVKWCDEDGTCWSCNETMETRRGNTLAAHCPPMLTSQMSWI